MALDNPPDVADDDVAAGSSLSSDLPARSLRQRLRAPLLIAGPILAIIIGLIIYLHGGRYQSTDNAYFRSGLGAVAANVSGPVVSIEVHDNQQVKAGQILFRIDPAPFQAAVDEAEAELADARTRVSSLRANYSQGQAELTSAQARLGYATREAARQKQLLSEGISSKAQYDQAQLAAQTAAQDIASTGEKNASVAASLSGKVNGPIDEQPAVKRVLAVLERARLNLSYTDIRAGSDGIVTKVDQLQRGDYVTAGKPVFTLAGNHIWIEANFKENQLDHIRIGQPATFKIDAFPSLHLTGRVASFSPGTGNSFALLPAENASGNWVKVVQRLPLELEVDQLPPDVPLHAGLSVNVTVDTGYRRHLFGAATQTTPR